MAVIRVIKDKENPYIMVNKYYIYDSRLSLKSKGLMSYFLSRPDDWEFYSTEIMQHCTDKKDSLSNAINELVEAGYIERIIRRDEKGKLKGGYDYTVHEIPNIITNEEEVCTTLTESGKTESGENRNREKPNSENPPLLNNEYILNNEYYYWKNLQEVIDYYCSKALILEVNIKPTEIESISKLLKDNLPMDLIKQGIDLAFKKFKPAFEGNKITSFKYCEPVIRGLWAKEIAKEEGGKDGDNKQGTGQELREQGIGI